MCIKDLEENFIGICRLFGRVQRNFSSFCRVDPQAISNPTARDVFTNALSMGEAIAERGERLWNEISRKVVDKPVHVSVIMVPKQLKLMQ